MNIDDLVYKAVRRALNDHFKTTGRLTPSPALATHKAKILAFLATIPEANVTAIAKATKIRITTVSIALRSLLDKNIVLLKG